MLPAPQPQISDDIDLWLAARAVRAACARHHHPRGSHGTRTVSAPLVERDWRARPDQCATDRGIFRGPSATDGTGTDRHSLAWHGRAVGTAAAAASGGRLARQLPGTRQTCTLDASNDYQTLRAWLALHETPATQRAYRKEAERLILWAIVDGERALSSPTTEDAIAYRSFLRRPTPRERWVAPPRPHKEPDWRPFAGNLSGRSVAYALSVVGALFRWMIEQRYVLANPFSGIEVRGRTQVTPLDTSHGFTEGEWLLVRAIADGLEWSYDWAELAAKRMRFMLDFSYATGLRVSVLVGATLGDIRTDEHGDHWVHLVGKDSRRGKVALPPLARTALDQYLLQRRLPVTTAR